MNVVFISPTLTGGGDVKFVVPVVGVNVYYPV